MNLCTMFKQLSYLNDLTYATKSMIHSQKKVCKESLYCFMQTNLCNTTLLISGMILTTINYGIVKQFSNFPLIIINIIVQIFV